MESSCQMKNGKNLKKNSYKCSLCRDTGWILVPQEGRNDLAVQCKCQEEEKSINDWKNAGINPEMCNQTFGTFNVWNEFSRKAKDMAAQYYKKFDFISNERNNSLLLCGQVGSGKSHLTIALGINFLKKNKRVLYMPYRDTITKIKQNMLDNEYYEKIISKYKTCDILLIDDLYKGKITQSDVNIIFEIINHRYLNHKPIIVSTEFTVEELLTFDEATGSRIYEMCKIYTIEIEKNLGNNYRIK